MVDKQIVSWDDAIVHYQCCDSTGASIESVSKRPADLANPSLIPGFDGNFGGRKTKPNYCAQTCADHLHPSTDFRYHPCRRAWTPQKNMCPTQQDNFTAWTSAEPSFASKIFFTFAFCAGGWRDPWRPFRSLGPGMSGIIPCWIHLTIGRSEGSQPSANLVASHLSNLSSAVADISLRVLTIPLVPKTY